MAHAIQFIAPTIFSIFRILSQIVIMRHILTNRNRSFNFPIIIALRQPTIYREAPNLARSHISNFNAIQEPTRSLSGIIMANCNFCNITNINIRSEDNAIDITRFKIITIIRIIKIAQTKRSTRTTSSKMNTSVSSGVLCLTRKNSNLVIRRLSYAARGERSIKLTISFVLCNPTIGNKGPHFTRSNFRNLNRTYKPTSMAFFIIMANSYLFDIAKITRARNVKDIDIALFKIITIIRVIEIIPRTRALCSYCSKIHISISTRIFNRTRYDSNFVISHISFLFVIGLFHFQHVRVSHSLQFSHRSNTNIRQKVC